MMLNLLQINHISSSAKFCNGRNVCHWFSVSRIKAAWSKILQTLPWHLLQNSAVCSHSCKAWKFFATPNKFDWICENEAGHWTSKKLVKVWDSRIASFRFYNVSNLWSVWNKQTLDLMRWWKNEIWDGIFRCEASLGNFMNHEKLKFCCSFEHSCIFDYSVRNGF